MLKKKGEIMFTSETNGYNKIEVENKITELEEKIFELEELIDKLSRNCQEKDLVNIKLATAVEKAKQIESSSNNLTSLKFKKFMVIYKTFEQSFATLFYNYPQLANISALKNILTQFKNDVNLIMENDFNSNSINAFVKTENDTIRLLLNKMSSYAKPSAESSPKSDKIKRNEPEKLHTSNSKEKSKPYEKGSQIKSISNLTLKNDEDYETIADKFLEADKLSEKEDDANSKSIYEKILSKSKNNSKNNFPAPNESGFDLKEAVNPKDEL